MKINEFGLSDILGSWGAAQLKGTSGATTVQKMAQQKFIDNFVGDALSNLDTAIKGGLVVAGKSGQVAQPANQAPAAAQPDAAPTAQQPQSNPSTTQQPQSNPSTGQLNINYQGKPVANNAPNLMPNAKKPEVKQPGMSYSTTIPAKNQPQASTAATTAPATTASNATQTSTQQPRQTYAQKGAAYQQQQNQRKALGKKNQPLNPSQRQSMPIRYPTREASQYDQLNMIFESLVGEDYINEADPKQPMSISQYLSTQWYPGFMQGVDYSAGQDKIDDLMKEIENTYSKDRGKAALNKLAQVSFALSANKLGGAVGKGAAKPGTVPASATTADQDQGQAGKPQQAATSTSAPNQSVSQSPSSGSASASSSLQMPMSKVIDILQASIKTRRDKQMVINYLQGTGTKNKTKSSQPTQTQQPKQEPITLPGGETIKPTDPRYDEIMKGKGLQATPAKKSSGTPVTNMTGRFPSATDQAQQKAAAALESKSNARRINKKPVQ